MTSYLQHRFFKQLLPFLILLISLPALAHDDEQPDSQPNVQSPYPSAPGDNYTWEEGCIRPDGQVVEGFWREADVDGYDWQQAGWDKEGNWVDYDYVPVESSPQNYRWVAGHRGKDGVWVMGFWRRSNRDKHTWSDGYYEDEEYVAPHWEPTEVEDNYIYERGYRASTGYWIPGFRRPRLRVGYRWASGYWDGPEYVRGYWRPSIRRAGYSYTPGHIGVDGYWVDGFWRPRSRVGYAWTSGYYVADTYVW